MMIRNTVYDDTEYEIWWYGVCYMIIRSMVYDDTEYGIWWYEWCHYFIHSLFFWEPQKWYGLIRGWYGLISFIRLTYLICCERSGVFERRTFSASFLTTSRTSDTSDESPCRPYRALLRSWGSNLPLSASILSDNANTTVKWNVQR